RGGAHGARPYGSADAILHLHHVRAHLWHADPRPAAVARARIRHDSGDGLARDDSVVRIPLGSRRPPADYRDWMRRDDRLSLSLLRAARFTADRARLRGDRPRPAVTGSAL